MSGHYYDDFDREPQGSNYDYNDYNNYSNSYNSRRSGKFSAGRRSGNIRTGRNRGYNRKNDRPIVKHTGCKEKHGWFSKATGKKIDSHCVYGWNASKGSGMISFIASPHKTKSKTSSPNQLTYMVKVTRARDRKEEWHIGFWNIHTKKLTIPAMQMVANPARDYFGTYVKRK